MYQHVRIAHIIIPFLHPSPVSLFSLLGFGKKQISTADTGKKDNNFN